jgi:hypothetical protein
MATLTRAQYLQVRAELRTLATVAKNLPHGDVLATIDQALAEGPAKNPKMWTEGGAQLQKDREFVAHIADFVKKV